MVLFFLLLYNLKYIQIITNFIHKRMKYELEESIPSNKAHKRRTRTKISKVSLIITCAGKVGVKGRREDKHFRDEMCVSLLFPIVSGMVVKRAREDWALPLECICSEILH